MEENRKNLVFGKKNYLLMIAGVVAICLGLFIMTLDNEDYGYGFMGITLGPLVLLLGFFIEFFAIMVRDKKEV
ncbi:MAG: DUF3098 domain-containing protein [Hymenobacteraceae bacterium]|nr:DUF3098 domain-containing protein [Hymenobacteraceae bacterium]MDX5396030.1 DUF3098 domain-containing protein [Hymenobacteraceae bacterium]MDX5512091.1 DUF3098 domain-containing protein [Hymenobacteraceae bacterium]